MKKINNSDFCIFHSTPKYWLKFISGEPICSEQVKTEVEYNREGR